MKTNINLSVLLLLLLPMLTVQPTKAQQDGYTFDKSEFFINNNACVNCHLFLKNYVIAYQNSARRELHLDISARDFGLNYLAAKGINVNAFDTVVFEGLNKRFGKNFESFAVIHKAGRPDTLSINEPLLYRDQDVSQRSENEQRAQCYSFTNRAVIRSSGAQFCVVDEFLKSSTLFIANAESLICVPDPFALKGNTHKEKHNKFFNESGIDMHLTAAMHPLMRQMDLADKRLTVLVFNERRELRGLVKHPYAYRTNRGDTALATIMCVHDNKGYIMGCFERTPQLTESPYDEGFAPFFNFGVGFQDDTVFVPIKKRNGNLSANDPVTAKYVPYGKGGFIFEEYANFVLQTDHNLNNISLGFSERYIFANQSGLVYDPVEDTFFDLEINVLSDGDFWLYSVRESDNGSLLLMYSNRDHLVISEYNLQESRNEVVRKLKKESNTLPVLQGDGVFVLSNMSSDANYTYYPFLEK